MGRKRFGFLAASLVALNLFLWLAPAGIAGRAALLRDLLGPQLVRLEAIVSTGAGGTEQVNVDRGLVTSQTATDLTLQEADGRVQDIPISPTTRILGRKNLQGWRVLVEWPPTGPAVWVQAEARVQPKGRARLRSGIR